MGTALSLVLGSLSGDAAPIPAGLPDAWDTVVLVVLHHKRIREQ